MSTYSLQDLINLIVYKGKDDKIMCEIYFKGRFECTRQECGELLGDLLNFKVDYSIDDDYGLTCLIDKSNIKKDNNFLFYSNIANILNECFVDEHFEAYDSYNSRELRHYFELCEKHNIKISIDSFETYLSFNNIPHKSFEKIMYTKEYNMCDSFVDSLGIYSEDCFNKIGFDNDTGFLTVLKNKEQYKTAYYYYDCQYTDFIYILTYHLLKNNVTLKCCKYCNKYFAQYKPNQKYCERVLIDLNNQILDMPTCSELAYKQVRKDREKNNDIIKLENSTRTMMLNRTKSKSYPKEVIEKREKEYIEFLNKKDEQKKRYKKGEITKDEYISFLKSFRLKKEGEQDGKHTED